MTCELGPEAAVNVADALQAIGVLDDSVQLDPMIVTFSYPTVDVTAEWRHGDGPTVTITPV